MKNSRFYLLLGLIGLVTAGVVLYISRGDSLLARLKPRGSSSGNLVSNTSPEAAAPEATRAADWGLANSKEPAATEPGSEAAAPAGEASQESAKGQITLAPLGDHQGSGTATPQDEGGQFRLAVKVNLPVAPEGKFYEAWLVGQGVGFEPFSIGRMRPQEGTEGGCTHIQ